MSNSKVFESKYTSEQIEDLLDKAKTSVQPQDITDKHSHTNMGILSKFREVDGKLYYNNQEVLFGAGTIAPEEPEPEAIKE